MKRLNRARPARRISQELAGIAICYIRLDIPATISTFEPIWYFRRGWKFGSALPIDSVSEHDCTFKTASLTRLIDSPVVAGRYFNRIELTRNSPVHEFDMAGDTAESVVMPSEMVDKYRRMVAETGSLYGGSRHYRSYHFLLTFSDKGGDEGLEHNESSEDGTGLKAIQDGSDYLPYLLCHEFTHSWNGKYRRPAGLATPDYHTPMKGRLLWVYEGLTEFIGTMLAPRSGLWTPEQYRDAVAEITAFLDTQQGRTWRPLEDTAASAQLLYGGDKAWGAARRGVDYYYESVLNWLAVDMKIRELTRNKKSLDDFCKAFLGGESGEPGVKPYEFSEVVATLNGVASYDWATFLSDRVQKVMPSAPVDGLSASGWRLVYTDKPNLEQSHYERQSPVPGLRYSLGMVLDDNAQIQDLVLGMPADKAGLTVGMKVVAVNGAKYSPEVLQDSLNNKNGKIGLLVDYNDQYLYYTVTYGGGPKHPHLERIASTPDLLSKLIAPHATSK